MRSQHPDPVMLHIRAHFERAEISLDELGLKMGYPKGTARKSAWQFLNRTNDPRVSMLRRFTKAVGVGLRDLV